MEKINNWTIISFSHSNKYENYYNCQCICGVKKVVNIKNIRLGKSKSCGCLRSGKRNGSYKHGKVKSRAFRTWTSMRKRCLNKKDPDYPNWGGRGIKIDPSWNEFINFYTDMGDPPKDYTLDRIDNNGNYCKENCRWVSRKTQNRNRRDNIYIEYKGQTKTLPEWAEYLNLTYHQLYLRLYRRKWSIEKAFNTL